MIGRVSRRAGGGRRWGGVLEPLAMLAMLAACQEPAPGPGPPGPPAPPTPDQCAERQIVAVLDGAPIYANEIQSRIAFRL